MKTVVLSLLILAFASVQSISDYRYVERVISPEASYYYDLNSHNDIAFIGLEELGDLQIFLHTAKMMWQLTESPPYNYYYHNIDMNDNQEIVWFSIESNSKGADNFYIKYKGEDGIKIIYQFIYTDPNNYPAPKINNNGYITWSYPLGYGKHPEIFLWDKKEVKTITQDNNPDYAPAINDNFVTWFGDNRSANDWDYSVKYYNIQTKETNAIPIKKAAFPLIDNDDNILFSINSGNTSELKLYSKGKITNISSNLYSLSYSISGGKIVWTDDALRVHLFANGADAIVSPDGQKCYLPSVNSDGLVTWQDETKNAWLKNGQEVIDLSTSDNCHSKPMINDNGLVVWRGADVDYYGATLYSSEYLNVFDVGGKVVLSSGVKPGGDIIQSTGLKDVLVTDGISKTMTNDDGEFKLTNLEKGTAVIKFSKEGFSFEPPEIIIEIEDQHVTIATQVIATPITGIDEELSITELNISPNPAEDYIEVDLGKQVNYMQDRSILIYDIMGKVVRSVEMPCDTKLKIDVSRFPSGFYFIRIGHMMRTFAKK